MRDLAGGADEHFKFADPDSVLGTIRLSHLTPPHACVQICQSLQKAALDPRIKGLAIEIGPLAIGWAKVQEIRRYLSYFRQSGKFTMVYMKQVSAHNPRYSLISLATQACTASWGP